MLTPRQKPRPPSKHEKSDEDNPLLLASPELISEQFRLLLLLLLLLMSEAEAGYLGAWKCEFEV